MKKFLLLSSVLLFLFVFTSCKSEVVESNDNIVDSNTDNGENIYEIEIPFAYTYLPESDSYSVRYHSGAIDSDFVIPSYYKGKPVTSIDERGFCDCSNGIKSLMFPESIQSIGYDAFAFCSNLETVIVNSYICKGGNNDSTLCEILGSYDNRSIKEIIIPESVIEIGKYAFHGCYELKTITMPEGVTSIGDSAFSLCKSLASIAIPEGVTSIGDRTFLGCSSLTTITIPASVTAVGYHAFDGCNELKEIKYGSTMADWKKIYFFESFEYRKFNVHCTDGSITSE